MLLAHRNLKQMSHLPDKGIEIELLYSAARSSRVGQQLIAQFRGI